LRAMEWKWRLAVKGAISGLATLALLPLLCRLFPRRRNVEGRHVPTGCGMAPLLAWLPFADGGLRGRIAPLMAAFGGLLDDFRPREGGGVSLRLRRLVRERRFDPALLKAVLVFFSAAALTPKDGGGATRLLDLLLVASFSHTVNLMDTAPGRAVKWLLFWGLKGGALLWRRGEGERILALLPALCAYAPGDLKGQHIMGDSGAYGLGVALGWGLTSLPLRLKGAMAALFLLLSLYAEGGSISRAIERRPLLRALDRLGRRELRCAAG